MVGVVIKYIILFLVLCLFILSFFKNIQLLFRIPLFLTSVFLFYLFIGIPFLLYSPVQCYLGTRSGAGSSGAHYMYRNILTGTIKEIRSDCIPIGWKFVETRFDKLPSLLPQTAQ